MSLQYLLIEIVLEKRFVHLQIALYHENVKKVKMKLDVCKLHQLPSFQ